MTATHGAAPAADGPETNRDPRAQLDLVLSTRSVSDAERAAFEQARRHPLREDILVIEGLVIVTEPDNSLLSISTSSAAL